MHENHAQASGSARLGASHSSSLERMKARQEEKEESSQRSDSQEEDEDGNEDASEDEEHSNADETRKIIQMIFKFHQTW